MGLTIHYGIRSSTRSDQKAHRLVEQMRQLALDLPFEEVSEAVTLQGKQCDVEAQRGKLDEALFWLLIQGGQHIRCPWNPNISRSISPIRLIAFDIFPGPGSEPANVGLSQYPKEVEWDYRPEDDRRFYERCRGLRSTGSGFSWEKWERWLRRNGQSRRLSPYDQQFAETRKVKTRLTGWRWSSFCKTQYASDPRCGGVANFLRCHISVVTLLDRIAELPTVKVEVDDEGKYGRSHYSDDWREAYEAGRKPTYSWHDGKYDPKALAEEVGEWNSMIAAQMGALGDMLEASGSDLEGCSPIQGFPDFEHLEFRGSQEEYLQPFLRVMAQLAEEERTKHASDPA